MRLGIGLLFVGVFVGCGRTALETGVDVAEDAGPEVIPVCGDGVVQRDEACDDRNGDPGDGCDACGVEVRPVKVFSIASDYEGGFVLAGSAPGDSSDRDAWLARYDAAGREQWDDAFEVDGVDEARDVAMRPNGIIAVVGDARGDEGTDVWLARYTGDGEQVWRIDTTFSGSDRASGVAFDPEGNAVVAGRTAVGRGGEVGWVGKFDREGDAIWRIPLAGSGRRIQPRGLAVDASGNIFVVATALLGGSREALVLKLDPAGEELWRNSHADHTPASIDVATDGAVFVVGWYERDFPPDVWVARYTSDGREVWSDRYDGPSSGRDSGYGVSAAEDGGAFVGGRITLTNELGNITPATWIRRYDAGGREVWTRTLDALDPDPGTGALSLATDPDGNLLFSYSGYDDSALVRRLSP